MAGRSVTEPEQVRVPYPMETLRLAPPLELYGLSPQGYIPSELHTCSLLELHACHFDLSNKGINWSAFQQTLHNNP
jgi:hypothetical protein